MAKVILYPGKILSSTDRDVHHISDSQLRNLYGVRKTDFVVVHRFNEYYSKDITERRYLEELGPEYLHLHPRRDGKYWDIHAKSSVCIDS